MTTGIRHLVVFTLKDNDENAESTFLQNSKKILSAIPGVKDFEVVKQVSVKNSFKYGFSMLFADQEHYEAYNAHKDHTSYLVDFWFKYVQDFLEIDTIDLE